MTKYCSNIPLLLLYCNILATLPQFYNKSAIATSTETETETETNPFTKYWIAPTKLFNSTRLKRNSLHCEQFHLNLKTYKELTLCVYRHNLSTYSFIKNSSKLIIQDSGNIKVQGLSAVDYISLIGYVVGQEKNSKVNGYLHKDRFLGRIVIDAVILYIEDLADYVGVLHLNGYDKDDSIIYQKDPVIIKCSDLLYDIPKIPQIPEGIFKSIFKDIWSQRSDSAIPPVDFSTLSCSLSIFIDTAYYKLVMGSDDQKTLHSVVHSIYVADSIFRSTNFMSPGTPTNLGFVIKQIQLFKTSYDSPLPSFYPFKRDSLKALSKFSDLDTGTANLAILFTGQSFQGGVNGLSYTAKLEETGALYVGGLCFQHPYGGNNRNALLVVGQGYASRRTQLILDLTLAHEIAHSFGASHDDDPSCAGHLMESIFNNMISGLNDRFSHCSIKDISRVLKNRYHCLEDNSANSSKSFCGNEIVETGEECDCGSKYMCQYENSCCYHYDSTVGRPCTKKKNKECAGEL